MKQSFEKGETEVIEQSMIDRLKKIEQSIRDLSDQRILLKSAIEKVKAQRPADYVEKTPVRKMYSETFEKNKSIAARINYILDQEKTPMTSADVTNKYVSLVKNAGGKKRSHTLKNISTILSIGTDKKYSRDKVEGKYVYSLMGQKL